MFDKLVELVGGGSVNFQLPSFQCLLGLVLCLGRLKAMEEFQTKLTNYSFGRQSLNFMNTVKHLYFRLFGPVDVSLYFVQKMYYIQSYLYFWIFSCSFHGWFLA